MITNSEIHYMQRELYAGELSRNSEQTYKEWFDSVAGDSGAKLSYENGNGLAWWNEQAPENSPKATASRRKKKNRKKIQAKRQKRKAKKLAGRR